MSSGPGAVKRMDKNKNDTKRSNVDDNTIHSINFTRQRDEWHDSATVFCTIFEQFTWDWAIRNILTPELALCLANDDTKFYFRREMGKLCVKTWAKCWMELEIWRKTDSSLVHKRTQLHICCLRAPRVDVDALNILTREYGHAYICYLCLPARNVYIPRTVHWANKDKLLRKIMRDSVSLI